MNTTLRRRLALTLAIGVALAGIVGVWHRHLPAERPQPLVDAGTIAAAPAKGISCPACLLSHVQAPAPEPARADQAVGDSGPLAALFIDRPSSPGHRRHVAPRAPPRAAAFGV